MFTLARVNVRFTEFMNLSAENLSPLEINLI